MRKNSLFFSGILALVAVTPVLASPINEPPPSGAILDLNGTPIPGNGDGTYQEYDVDFIAALPGTAISFAFREDSADLALRDVSVTDLTTSSGNLLVNGDFTGGVYTDNGNPLTPDGWIYLNPFGASFRGGVSFGEWVDGTVQLMISSARPFPRQLETITRSRFSWQTLVETAPFPVSAPTAT
jgi:hypothetical protein